MKKLKILYIAPEIAIPGVHGGAIHVKEVVESLSRLENEVLLISRYSLGLNLYEKKGRLSIVRFPIFGPGILKNIFYMLYSIFVFPFFMFFGSVDVIYERARLFGGISLLFSRILRKKSIYELNEPIESVGLGKGLLHKLAISWGRFMAKRATLITGTHSSFFKYLPSHKCFIIDYGANPNIFNPNVDPSDIIKKYSLKKGKVVLYVGSFAPWHAITSMIYAAKEFCKKDKFVKFILVGEGGKYNSAKTLVRDLRLDNNVILTGRVDNRRMPEYLNASTVALALFDRDHEEFRKHDYFYSPIKLHEYKSCGKPIIASSFGNLRKYIVNGRNGYLVDESNIKQISDKILKLINNKKLINKIGKLNRFEVLKKYNWDSINRNILEKLSEK